MSSKSTRSADRIILELLTSAKMVAALLVVSLMVEMNGPKVSATLPAAAIMPMIDAATLKGSAMIYFGMGKVVDDHLEALDNIHCHDKLSLFQGCQAAVGLSHVTSRNQSHDHTCAYMFQQLQ